MAIFRVINNQDSGIGSLRQAIDDANKKAGLDQIIFAESLNNTTINLVAGDLTITDDVTIVGLGADALTLDATNSSSRLFTIDDRNESNLIKITLTGLTLSGGSSNSGGGIRNLEELTLTEINLVDNIAIGNGGAIHNQGDLTLIKSTIQENGADLGGGIYNQGHQIITDTLIRDNFARAGGGIYNQSHQIVTDTLLENNSAKFGGGGIYNFGDSTIISSEITDNYAYGGGGINNSNDSILTITDVVIANNSSGYGGGINNDGLANIDSSLIFGNSADNVRGDFISNGNNTLSDFSGSTGFDNDTLDSEVVFSSNF